MDTIQLLEPANESTTPPLQLHTWQIGSTRDGDEEFDRSQPRLVEFAWQPSPGVEASLRYSLTLAEDAAFTLPLRLERLRQPRAVVANLRVGTRYYWQVTARRMGRPVAASPVWSFTTHPQPPRWILAPGVTNLRDFGGWQLPDGRRIRQGMIFRSSEMNSHLHITRAGRQVIEDELGIRTDIDLRGGEELREPALNPAKVEYINIPILSYEYISEPYSRVNFRSLFQMLANPLRYPLLIHCWGGADRTGTVIFLIQALLGLDFDALVLDYESTSLSIFGERLHTAPEFRDFLTALAEYAPPGASLQAQVEGYLATIGVSPAEIDLLRSLLIEG